MSFFPTSRSRIVPGIGRDTDKIVIVGDYTSPFDDKTLVPFSGPAGSILESCLHAARLIKGEVYLTNVFKSKTSLPGNRANTDFFIDDGKKRFFTELGQVHAQALVEELDKLNPNVIIAAGNPALMALTNFNSVAKYRGYVCASTKLKRQVKVIPTYSPMSTLRGNYINRHAIVADIRKAKIESAFPELVRPERTIMYHYDTVEEVLEWLEHFENCEKLAFDIEVINYEVSCLSLASSAGIACVVPIGESTLRPKGWTEDEELQIWRAIQRVLGNPKSVKIAQNCIFDIHFLLTRCGIEVKGEVHDTMIGHSVMFPEFPKGLGFLGSMYCGAQEYWKDAVSFKSIKGDD
jgi:uracil-DNA glycosylase family 4